MVHFSNFYYWYQYKVKRQNLTSSHNSYTNTLFKGKWRDNKLESGRFFRTTSVRTDDYGMLIPEIEFPTNQIETQSSYCREPSTAVCISKSPMTRDPYEHQTVYVAKSKQGEYAGEGLFAKRLIPSGSLVALFNGVRQRDPIYSKNMPEFSDYRIALDRVVSLDIPEKSKNLINYRATVGHKTCHSFKPNSTFSEINHPRFGKIMSVVATKDIPSHEEILVTYGYRIWQSPAWYTGLWFEYLREDLNLTEEQVFHAARKESRFSQAPVSVPPPHKSSSRFLPCGECKEHIGFGVGSFNCDICKTWYHLSCTQIEPNNSDACLERKESITCDGCSAFR